MIINQFSSFPHGGAGTAARRLHECLLESGYESRFLFWKNQANAPVDHSFRQLEFRPHARSGPFRIVRDKLDRHRQRRIYNDYDRHIRDRDHRGEVFTAASLPNRTRFDFGQFGADIVHLHWLAFFADYSSFFQSIPDHVPIVWTLHDMNPFTGGCHYSNGCSRYTSGCGNCPQLVMPTERDVSRTSYQVKQAALARKNLHIVTPSRWLADLARQSGVFHSMQW